MVDRFIARRRPVLFPNSIQDCEGAKQPRLCRKSRSRSQAIVALSAAAVASSFFSVARADIFGVNGTSTELDLSSSWTNESGVNVPPPTGNDIAQWDALDTLTGAQTYTLFAPATAIGNTTWGEISITGAYTGGAITINDAGNTTVNTLTLNGVNGVGIDMSAATQNLTIADSVILGNPQTWNIGLGRTLTVSGAISGTSFTKLGAGTLALTTTADTFTGNLFVNAGTLSVAVAQSATAGFTLANGTTLTTTQSMAGSNVITVPVGTATFTTTGLSTAATFNGVFAGNGNINAAFSAGLNTDSPNMLSEFGGTFSFGSSNNFGRVAADTTGENFLAQYATIDLGTGSATIQARNNNDNVEIGALTGGINTTLGGASTSGTVVYTIGSNNANSTFAGQVTQGAALVASWVKTGSGTFVLTDAKGTAFTGTGTVSINGGTVKADYTNSPTGIFAATTPIGIGGGTLYLLGKNTGATTQTLGNVTLTGVGGAGLVVDTNGGSSFGLTLGTITATANGASLNISTPGSGTATITTTTNKAADGTYGGRITYGTDWATTASAVSPFTLSAYSGYTAFTGSTDVAATDYLLSGSNTLGATESVNSLKITTTGAGQILDLTAGTLTLTNGGLLFAGSNDYSINNGTLKSNIATNSDLIVQQLGAGNLTIGSVIANGIGASIVTKAGSGMLTLTGSNTYTGTTVLNGGILSVSANANLGLESTGALLSFNGGTLQATSSFTLENSTAPGTNKRNVNILGGGATFDVTSSNTLTVDGVVGENNIFQFGELKKTDSGTLVLSGANTYGGATVISGGVLSVATLANGGVIAANGASKTETNSPTLTIANTAGIAVGQSVLGASIPAGATVLSISGNTVTISANATPGTAGATQPVTFYTPSPLGSAPNVAPSLVLDGGTLRYTGPTVSTDRTFTLTNNGGALDGSGGGPVTFSNVGAVATTSALAGTGSRVLTLTGTTAGNVFAGQLGDSTGGTTGLTKSGSGSWIITNTGHTYTGTTSITGGTLGLSSTTSSNLIATSATVSVGPGAVLDVTGQPGGSIALASGQTLTGSGSVSGSVLNTAGSIIAPGTIVANTSQSGTLTVGNLSLASGSILNFGLSSANLAGGSLAGADLISTGALTMPSSGAIADLFQPGTTSQFTVPGTYDLVHYASLLGSVNNTTMTAGNGNGAFSYTFSTLNNYLTVQIVQLAVSGTWNDGNISPNNNPANWSTSANWSGGVPGANIGDSATFGSTTVSPASGSPITSVVLNANETLGGITFSNSSGYTISEPSGGGTNAITINNGATNPATIHVQSGSQTINVPLSLAQASTSLATNVSVDNATDTLTLGGAISGAGSLTKSGPGTLILSNTTNTYGTGAGGGTTINGGVLQFSAMGALGSGTNLTFGGGTLRYSGNVSDISTDTVTIKAGGATIDTNGSNVQFANPIGNSGTGGLTKIGAGTLTLASTSNAYSGNTIISGGTLNFAALNSLGTGTNITFSNGAALQWAAGNVADISARTVTVGAGGATFDANGNGLNFTGPIGNNGSGAVTFTSTAPGGSFALNAPSSYTGGTTINNLTVNVNDPTAFAGGTFGTGGITFQGTSGAIVSNYATAADRFVVPTVAVGSGVVASITGGTTTVLTGLTGNGTINLVSTALPTANSSNVTGIAFAAGGFGTFNGTINISSSSAANNGASMWFNGGVPSNFNGSMPSATVNLLNNIRLSASDNSTGNTWTVGALSSDSTSILAGSDFGGNTTTAGFNVTVGGLNTNTILAGSMINGTSANGSSGLLLLTKVGNGTLTISGNNNTYSGGTTVNAGILKVTNTSGSATGYGPVAVNSGGTLAGNGFISGQGQVIAGVPTPVSVLVTVAGGGAISPSYPTLVGSAVNTLTMDALTLNAPATTSPQLSFEFNGTTNNDELNVTQDSALTINGGLVNVYNSTTGAIFSTPGTYNLIEYTGGISGIGTGALVVSPAELALSNTSYSFGTATVGANQFITLTIAANPTNYWTNHSGDSNWGTLGNWSGAVPNAPAAIADFDSTSNNPLPYSVAQNVNLQGGNFTIGSLTFNSTPSVTIGGGGSLSMNNGSAPAKVTDNKGTHTVAVPLGGGAQGLNVSVTNVGDSLILSGGVGISGPLSTSGAGTINFSGSINNASALNATGPGTVILSADNTGMDGATTVSGGTLSLRHANALITSMLSVSGTGVVTFAPAIGTYNAAGITSGPIALQDTATPTPGPVTLSLGGTGANFTYSGALSGPGSLTLVAGTMNLTGVSNITGNVNVNGGLLNVAAVNAYTATNTTIAAGATLNINGGDSFTGNVTMSGGSIFSFSTTTSTFPVNNILLAPTANAGNPAIMTSGSEASEYGGVITFDAGGLSEITLQDTATAISFNSGTTNFAGTGTVLVASGEAIRFTNGGGTATNGAPTVTFDVDGSMFTRTGTTGTGIVMGALTSDGAQGNLGGQTNTPGVSNLYTVGGLGQSTTFGGTLTDGADGGAAVAGATTALTVVGGTLTLTGASSNTGPMTVNGTGAALVLDYPGSLATNTFAATAGTLRINGTIANPAAALNASGSGTVIVGNNNDNPNSSPSGAPSVRNVGSVVVGTGGTVAVANSVNGRANRTVLVVGSPTLAGTTTFSGGKLDMGNNDMIVSEASSPTAGFATLTSLDTAANSALTGGAGIWAGAGLTTSSGAANSKRNTGLAIVVNDTHQSGTLSTTPLFNTFDGQPVADGDVLVKYTLFGDALMTGTVTSADYIQIDNGFNSGSTLKGWYNGDFNYDGVINGDDYALIDNAYNTQAGVSFAGISAGPAEMIATNTDQIAGASSSAVPEPTTLGMLGIGAAGLMMRRRRKHA